jgi:anaphase-promoting complex subunit 10
MADEAGTPAPGDADDGADVSNASLPAAVTIADGPPTDPDLRELGCLATWSVSTAKVREDGLGWCDWERRVPLSFFLFLAPPLTPFIPTTPHQSGNGADLLRDGRTDTYWQSDGPGPHMITAALPSSHRLALLALALDHRLDESYTPRTVSVRAGSWGGDLKEVAVADLAEPVGWALIPLTPPPGSLLPAEPPPQGSGGGSGVGGGWPGGGGPGVDGGPRPPPIQAAVLQVAVLANHQNGRDTHVRQALLFGPRGGGGTAAGVLGADIPLRGVDAAAWAGVR